jgi:hypothetical protein
MVPRHWSEWTWPIDDLLDLTDYWVVGIVAIGLILILWATWRTFQVWMATGKYLRLAKKLGSNGVLTQTRSEWSQRKGYRLATDFNDMLVEVPRPGEPLEKDLKRCGSASEVFNTSSMG